MPGSSACQGHVCSEHSHSGTAPHPCIVKKPRTWQWTRSSPAIRNWWLLAVSTITCISLSKEFRCPVNPKQVPPGKPATFGSFNDRKRSPVLAFLPAQRFAKTLPRSRSAADASTCWAIRHSGPTLSRHSVHAVRRAAGSRRHRLSTPANPPTDPLLAAGVNRVAVLGDPARGIWHTERPSWSFRHRQYARALLSR